MRRLATAAFLAFLFSIPFWVSNLYVLHVLIITGIFTIAAMSLNLLLGYTGQLSLGHVAFFGIGAYAASLVSLGFAVHLAPDWLVTLDPQPVWFAMLCAIAISGFCGWAIGRISFKVRGAYFVIVTISFAEVVRLVALNWDELTNGPMALNNVPPLTVSIPGLIEFSFIGKVANYYLVLATAIVAYVVIARLVRSQAGRAMIALKENEPLAMSVGRGHALSRAFGGGVGGDRGNGGRALRAIHPDRGSQHIPVHLYRDDGDHGCGGRQGHACRPDRRRLDFRALAGGAALIAGPARTPVGRLRRADDSDCLHHAERHRPGARPLVERSQSRERQAG